MKLYIKNMFCNHCKGVVRNALLNHGLHPVSVDFCEAETREDITPEQLDKLSAELKRSGLELISDKKHGISEKIKTHIIDLIRYSDEKLHINLSGYLEEELHNNYNYLSNIFSETQGMTIEKFYIMQKIERVKELIIIGELNLSEIAVKLHYSSLSHLSKQFSDLTGMTPTRYRQLRKENLRLQEEL